MLTIRGKNTLRHLQEHNVSECPHEHDYFDRSICPEPCGAMHYRCTDCGWALDYCPHEDPDVEKCGSVTHFTISCGDHKAYHRLTCGRPAGHDYWHRSEDDSPFSMSWPVGGDL